MRAKWSAPIRRYWKISEQMMVKYSLSFFICLNTLNYFWNNGFEEQKDIFEGVVCTVPVKDFNGFPMDFQAAQASDYHFRAEGYKFCNVLCFYKINFLLEDGLLHCDLNDDMLKFGEYMPRTKRKVKSIVKTKVISARVTETVHELLHRQAEDAGMTLSQFAAQMLMKDALRESAAAEAAGLYRLGDAALDICKRSRAKSTDAAGTAVCGPLAGNAGKECGAAALGRCWYRQEFYGGLHCQCPDGTGSGRLHDEFCPNHE